MDEKRGTDVLVIGGGGVGCAIVYYLRKARRDVTLLERGEIGSEASGAAAGLLAPLGPLSGPGAFADLVLAGFSTLVALLPELEESSGIHVGYEQTGALRIVRNPRRIAHLQKRRASWEPLGLQLYWLNGEEARQREPLLDADTCAAVYAPEESQIHAAALVQAFARAAERAGARIYQHREVSHFSLKETKVAAAHTTRGETFTCNTLIIASGAWAAQFGAMLRIDLPIQPLHGQLIAFPQTSPPLRHIVFGEAAYLLPRGDSILVGATKEERGFDRTVTESGSSWLAGTAARLIPALAGSKIQAAWAGLRPGTPDSHPILGVLPLWENVLLAAGHNSVGILLSALTGQCITELLTTGSAPPLIQPFSVKRFSSM